jgi:hypothetical protein
VWHASVSYRGNPRSTPSLAALATRAERVLQSVGDPTVGEWGEIGTIAFHLRRRLTDAEWGGKPWGYDLRGTPEGDRRLTLAGVPRTWGDEWTSR